MYTRHKVVSATVFVATTIASFFSSANYQELAVAALTVVSIALAVYIAAMSALLGSQYADTLKSQPDTKIKGKTQLGVFTTYLRIAGTLGAMCIAVSSIYQFTSFSLDNMCIKQFTSALACGLFALNVLFLWLIFSFLATALLNSARRK